MGDKIFFLTSIYKHEKLPIIELMAYIENIYNKYINNSKFLSFGKYLDEYLNSTKFFPTKFVLRKKTLSLYPFIPISKNEETHVKKDINVFFASHSYTSKISKNNIFYFIQSNFTSLYKMLNEFFLLCIIFQFPILKNILKQHFYIRTHNSYISI